MCVCDAGTSTELGLMTELCAQTGTPVSRRGGSTVEGRAEAKCVTSIVQTMTKVAGVTAD